MQRLALSFTNIGQMAAIALAFVLPISTSLTSILMAVVLLAWILAKDQSQKLHILLSHHAMKWIYPYILLTLVGAFYSIGENKEIINGLTDGLRLMLIP